MKVSEGLPARWAGKLSRPAAPSTLLFRFWLHRWSDLGWPH